MTIVTILILLDMSTDISERTVSILGDSQQTNQFLHSFPRELEETGPRDVR